MRTTSPSANRYTSFMKPLFVAVAFAACRLLFSGVSLGYMNPTVVVGVWIFNLLVYNNLTVGTPPQTLYDRDKYGEWVWIYFFASLLAAPFAGFLAKQILTAMNNN